MPEYQLQEVDASGARFTLDHGERLFMVYVWLAPAALLTFFAAQVWFTSDDSDRIYAYALIGLAAAFAAVTVIAARRPAPPAVLHFDNASRTLRFEDARGRPLSSVPYAEVGPFVTGRHTGRGGDGHSRTYHTIRVTLRDGRTLRLGGNTSEATRDAQLARLRDCVAIPGEPGVN